MTEVPGINQSLPPSIPEDRKAKIFNPKNKLFPFQRKVQLSEDQRQDIEKDLTTIYNEWESGTAILRSQNLRWVNNSEGISEPTNFPWEGASSIYKPITETRMNIVHSFWMSIIRPRIGRLFQVVTENPGDKEESDLAVTLTAYFNNNRSFNQMYVKSSSEAFWAKLRDGTVGRSTDWERRVERRWEIKTYSTPEEFLEANPTPSSIGIKEEQFNKILDTLRTGEKVSLDEDFDVVVKDMPMIDTEEIKDVVFYPPTVGSQERARFIGKRFWMRKSELMQRVKDGIYEKDAVNFVVQGTPSEERDEVSVFQNQIEGISEANTKSEYRIIQGRYSMDLDEDGIEEKFLVTFECDSKKVLQMDKYPLYHGNDNIRISQFKKRPKRLIGRGVPQMLDDLNTEANIQARFRINSMAIVNSPQFKAADTLKSYLDPARLENRIRPGGIWFIPKANFNDIEPVDLSKKNFTDNFREEAFLNQSADNLLGASELRSGRETPNDPRAPAQKTAMLLQQSSTRLDDFIFDTILSENESLDDCLRLYYQFGPDKLKVYVQTGDPGKIPEAPVPGAPPAPPEPQQSDFVEKVVQKSQLNKDTLHLQLSVTSLLDNPEYLKAKWEEFYAKYGPEPMIGNMLEARWEILNQIIQNMPEASGKKILMPLKYIMEHQPKAPQQAPGGPGDKPKASASAAS